MCPPANGVVSEVPSAGTSLKMGFTIHWFDSEFQGKVFANYSCLTLVNDSVGEGSS
jgi:hypothetical protein